MAASGGLISESSDVSQWLKNLPLAPEYHPTPAEFQDPIAYIFKIEKEAANYGICKIVPPVVSAPKKTAISNLNRSLAARSASKSQPTFTTRQQQIGFCPRKPCPVKKPVWESGDDYTFQEFEAKAKAFERNYLKKCTKKAALSPLEIETLYWKATVDKPFSVEYANDMPGSAFSVRKSGGKEMGEGVTVGETEWNMRGVSRAKGSLLRFMKEEIPGVTSPMVYIAMMFSWFAWHVEDHDLHSLNYLHMGAGKTWYGVPREAAVAFEDVVRVHGYGGEINPLVTFSVLGEKTTIMSPEVFVSAGVPCCRLVQNAGEFVVTFPRAYHSGFSHGFNCGEAANIATPEWLKVAKDAAVRRASINCPPMVSHFQLLYDLALELCTRIPMSFGTKPRSSRLKNKKKGEGETLIKQLFVENVVHNNDLLHKLGKGSSVILLPRTCSETSVCSNSRLGSQLRASPSLGFCRNKGIMKSSESSVPYETENFGFSQLKEQSLDCGTEKEENGQKLSDQRLFSCATCGILSFDCVAVVRPREEASRYLMSADCSFLNDWIVGSDGFTFASGSTNSFERNPFSRSVENDTADGLYHVPVKTINCETRNSDQNAWASNSKSHGDTSALGLLASNYANSSDSEDEMVEPGENCMALNSALQSSKQECHNSESASQTRFSSRLEHEDESIDCHVEHGHGLGPADFKGGSDIKHGSVDFNIRNLTSPVHITSNCSTVVHDTEPTKIHRVVLREDTHTMFPQRTDEQSSRIHVFCLEHAIEVEQRFSRIGGVHILLLCHPEYPKIEAEAKLASEELGIDYLWNDITFRDPTREDEENIQSAFDSEEATPGSGDWAVKMGINLFYSANLSRSSLYSKQMPYNSVIYDAFGYTSPASSPSKLNVYGRKRKVVVGRWCGKVWMSNQVHPFLIKPDTEDLDYEHEQDRSFSGWNIRDEKFERKLKNICNTKTTLAATKSARKRKKPMISGPAKKVKCLLAGDAGSEDSEEGVNCKQDIRVYSRKHKNHILREISCDSLKDGRKLGTVGEREYEGSDNSLEGNLHRRIRRKPAKYIDSDNDVSYSQKQKNRFSRTRSKKVKYVERDSEISNDSLDGEIHDRHRRFPRRTQSKYFERENAVSDDSLEQSSPEMVCRGKRGAFNEKEDRNSDDSVENSSLQQSPMISGSREHEEVSDDFDREGENSDDSLENNMDWKRLRTLKGKKAKFVEREDSVSGCLLESNIQCQPWVVPRSKRTKFIESEDRISDEFSEDNACLKHFRIPRIKEDRKLEQIHISNDLQEEDTRWRPTNRSRRLPVTSLTVTSNDEDDDTHWQTHKTSRSKERKIVPKMKREAPRQRGNAQLNNKVTSQVTKQEKETTQLRNGKNQHHSRQFLSNIEDELEGGPSTRLRRRPAKPPKETETNPKEKLQNKEKKQPLTNPKNGYQCDIEGCTMSFRSKQELAIHKRNICPVKGCGKTFFSHKYLVQHRRVHSDDRPLKCPWKGCKMTFKWAWARTEHIRVHTGARPYVCAEEGCGQTFRFVSDFSRHKRKTGHSVKKNIA